VIAYDRNRARVAGFVSTGATRRALQMVGSDAEVEVEIRRFVGAGPPVLPGCPERLEFVDATSHIDDLKRCRALGYATTGNRIRIVTDHDADLIEAHPPSRGPVEMARVTIERCRPPPAMG
jgi:hypothetical protein